MQISFTIDADAFELEQKEPVKNTLRIGDAEITPALQRIAKSGPQNRRRSREKVEKAFYSQALPLTCAFTALFYVNLPSAIRILSTSTMDLWNFDVSSTLYVMVVWVLLALALFNGLIAAKIAIKWRSLR